MKLHSYWRSSASYRVRIFLNLKGVSWDQETVHLVQDGGQQHTASYRKLNPSGLVPVLEDQGLTLNQSLAIMEYLEEKHPNPALMPAKAADKARVRALCYDIACDAAPLNNLRVQQYLSKELQISDEAKEAYLFHWLELTFSALEERVEKSADIRFLFGDQLTMADVVLVPQIYNAKRLQYDMSQHPKLDAIWHHCNTLKPFIDASPENQPDAI